MFSEVFTLLPMVEERPGSSRPLIYAALSAPFPPRDRVQRAGKVVHPNSYRTSSRLAVCGPPPPPIL